MNANAKKWIEALESGNYKQGKGFLKTQESGEEPKYCCLGVACELYLSERGEEWSLILLKDSNRLGFYIGHVEYDNQLHPSVQEWLGLSSSGGRYDNNRKSLWELNDAEDYSFEQIAAVIKSEPEGLFLEE